MLQRLSIEWMKLKSYRTFWVLSILYLVSIFGANYIVYRIQQEIYEAKEAKGMAEMMLGTPPYAFPNVWHMASYVSSFLLFLPGLLMIVSITNEYSYKTHRQNIIDGWSRQQFITTKLATAIINAAASTIMVFLTALIFGFINGEPFDTDKMINLVYFFIQALSYTMVALLFALLFRRGALAIGLFFLYAIVLENLLAGLMNHFLNYSGRYLPLEATDNLVPLPLFQNVQRRIVKPPNSTVMLVVSLAYLAFYFFVSYRKFEKDDL
jgi:ABC-2 type transport system permease protein